jgi:hypothetical protein
MIPNLCDVVEKKVSENSSWFIARLESRLADGIKEGMLNYVDVYQVGAC